MSTTGDAERLVEGEEHVSLRHLGDAIRRLDELGLARLIGDAAVSYTHLTLPTILRV